MRLKKYIINDQEVPANAGATTTNNIAKYVPFKKKKKSIVRRLSESTQVANEILRQIRTIDKWALGAWGARQFIATNDPPGVQFLVNGRKFKGKVIITLNGKDLYDVEFGIIKMPNWVSKHKEHDIYVEELVKVIDDYVEK